jgi:hypothetical protein
MTTTQRLEATLPGAWRLVQVDGWMPLGRQGRLTDTSGWIVCQPHVLAYGMEQAQIDRAETCGRTAQAAVDAFHAKFPNPADAPRAY